MTIVSAPNQISLADIKTEFGGDASDISLFDYYAGGSYVAAGTTGDGGAIPSSGELTVQDFYGATAVTVTLSGQAIIDSTPATTAKAGLRVNADGTIDGRIGDVYPQIDSATDWIIPNSSADSTYDVRITGVSFSVGSGFDVEAAAEDTWVSVSGNPEWSVFDPTDGGTYKACTFTLEIRKDAGAAIDTGAYSLDANYDSS